MAKTKRRRFNAKTDIRVGSGIVARFDGVGYAVLDASTMQAIPNGRTSFWSIRGVEQWEKALRSIGWTPGDVSEEMLYAVGTLSYEYMRGRI